MRYRARKDVVVGGLRPDTSPVTVDFAKAKNGVYETTDPDEIRLLDAVAELEDNPVGFDPKDKE